MTLTEIANMRLANQQVSSQDFKNIKDLAGWMCAMQAQDYMMAKWAIGIRVQNVTDKSVETAIDNGEIIRTHLMRPTWHFVNPEDLRWLLELTAPRIKASQKSRNRELMLSDAVFERTNSIIREALKNGAHLTREELMLVFKNEGIETANNRGSHILFTAELDGITCSGRIKNKKQTYSLINGRVPEVPKISREEALKKIALKYFLSHGPATLQDFRWWSGLSAVEAASGLEMIRPQLIFEKAESSTYWFSSFIPVSSGDNQVYLLPAFDEFIISYKDRNAVISLLNHKKTISDNGIFRPVIVINGQVTGLWKRILRNNKIIIETGLFQKYNNKIMRSIEKKAEEYGSFLNKSTEIIHHII